MGGGPFRVCDRPRLLMSHVSALGTVARNASIIASLHIVFSLFSPTMEWSRADLGFMVRFCAHAVSLTSYLDSIVFMEYAHPLNCAL
jgi:hypothetical protein